MTKLIANNKRLVLCIYVVLAAGFFTKLGYEIAEHKGIQKEEYTGARLK